MAQDRLKPDDLIFDDPKGTASKGKIIAGSIALATQLHDGTATGGPLWKKCQHLSREDFWALAGFGTTTKFDDWSVDELNRLSAAVGLHLQKTYMGAKYVCCTCC